MTSPPTLGDLEILADGSLVHPDHKAARYGRSSGKTATDRTDHRTPTERDRGRLQYSPYLRRLAGVTQIVSPELGSAELHSRASHTHKVAMLAREIAENVTRRATIDSADGEALRSVISRAGGLDIAACEAAGLAHDLGHPPFGHAGEEALDTCYRGPDDDGFEGNAQSFRIVTRLDHHNRSGVTGLDLCYVTLAAILKYPYVRGRPYDSHQKFGAYEDDKQLMREARRRLLKGDLDRQQTLEASVMDLADDIAYSVHDLEDFLGAGVISLHDVLASMFVALKELPETDEDEPFEVKGPSNPFLDQLADLVAKYDNYVSPAKFRAVLEEVHNQMKDFGPLETIETRDQIRDWLGTIIGQFFDGICVSNEEAWKSGPLIRLESDPWHLMHVLKVIPRQFMVSTGRLGLLQRAQRSAITSLTEQVDNWLGESPAEATLPVDLRRVKSEGKSDPARVSRDYVCTLADEQALTRSRWLQGVDAPGVSSLGAHQ